MCSSLVVIIYLYSSVFIHIQHLPFSGVIPYDGVPHQAIANVALPVTVIFTFSAIAGLIFAVVCLVFIFIFRKRKCVAIKFYIIIVHFFRSKLAHLSRFISKKCLGMRMHQKHNAVLIKLFLVNNHLVICLLS